MEVEPAVVWRATLFEYLESKAYKMHIRVLLSGRSYTECPTCAGARLKTESLLWRIGKKGAGGCGAGALEAVHAAGRAVEPCSWRRCRACACTT